MLFESQKRYIYIEICQPFLITKSFEKKTKIKQQEERSQTRIVKFWGSCVSLLSYIFCSSAAATSQLNSFDRANLRAWRNVFVFQRNGVYKKTITFKNGSLYTLIIRNVRIWYLADMLILFRKLQKLPMLHFRWSLCSVINDWLASHLYFLGSYFL